jgi:hypothetical protein
VLTFPAQLTVADGLPRRGRLRLSSEAITWRSTWRSLWRGRVDLTGAGLLSAGLQHDRHRRGDAELRLRSADGAAVHLQLGEAEGAATARALTGRTVPGLDPWRVQHSGRVWWAVAALTVGALWIALWVLIGLDGYTATADVVRSDGGWICTVTWEDPDGTTQQDD